jgi:hypothetical protein
MANTEFEKRIAEMLSNGQTEHRIYDFDEESWNNGFAAWCVETYEYNNTSNCAIILLDKKR